MRVNTGQRAACALLHSSHKLRRVRPTLVRGAEADSLVDDSVLVASAHVRAQVHHHGGGTEAVAMATGDRARHLAVNQAIHPLLAKPLLYGTRSSSVRTISPYFHQKRASVHMLTVIDELTRRCLPIVLARKLNADDVPAPSASAHIDCKRSATRSNLRLW